VLAFPGLKTISLATRLNRHKTNISHSCELLTASSAVKTENATLTKKKNTFRSLLPILASAFCAAAIMYPLDLVRALQMANAGAGLSTRELLANFHKAHGIKGEIK
jgi:hypothetical protein